MHKGFAISAILHGILIIAISLTYSPSLKKQIAVLELAKVEMRVAPLKHVVHNLHIVPASPKGPKPCERWYGGIGIYTHPEVIGYTLIEGVMEGYAAYNAGVKPGDLLDQNSSDPLLGNPGEPIHVVIYRDEVRIDLNVIRSKVCTD